MGLALTKHLIDRGYKVGMCDINAEAGKREAANFGGDRAVFIPTDLTSYEDQAAAFQSIWASWGRLDFGEILSHSSHIIRFLRPTFVDSYL